MCVHVRCTFFFIFLSFLSLCHCHPSVDCDITIESNLYNFQKSESKSCVVCASKARERMFTIVSESYAYQKISTRVQCTHKIRRRITREQSGTNQNGNLFNVILSVFRRFTFVFQNKHIQHTYILPVNQGFFDVR